MGVKKDNSTLLQKVTLRLAMLKRVDEPVIMETHGGYGRIWESVYSSYPDGVVFDKNPMAAAHLARQRPTWAVYEADCVGAIAQGAGAHLPVNVLDVDPYGDPWPTITAFFDSDRPRVDKLFVVVNDGLRHKVRMGSSWSVGSLASAVERYGNDLHDIYIDVCREMMKEKAVKANYTLTAWAGYYCGHAQQMTHYLAILDRQASLS